MNQEELDERRKLESRAWKEHLQLRYAMDFAVRQWIADVLRAIADAPHPGDSPLLFLDAFDLAPGPELHRLMVFDGKNKIRSEPLFPDIAALRMNFDEVLKEGFDGDRVRRCPICDCLFWARNVTQAACSPKHSNVARQRAYYRAHRAKILKTKKMKRNDPKRGGQEDQNSPR
jgi:hypothetical protein